MTDSTRRSNDRVRCRRRSRPSARTIGGCGTPTVHPPVSPVLSAVAIGSTAEEAAFPSWSKTDTRLRVSSWPSQVPRRSTPSCARMRRTRSSSLFVGDGPAWTDARAVDSGDHADLRVVVDVADPDGHAIAVRRPTDRRIDFRRAQPARQRGTCHRRRRATPRRRARWSCPPNRRTRCSVSTVRSSRIPIAIGCVELNGPAVHQPSRPHRRRRRGERFSRLGQTAAILRIADDPDRTVTDREWDPASSRIP